MRLRAEMQGIRHGNEELTNLKKVLNVAETGRQPATLYQTLNI